MKWNEWGFRLPLCTYRIKWARRSSWGYLYEWDDTALRTQDSKSEPWRSGTEQATSRSRRLPMILNLWNSKAIGIELHFIKWDIHPLRKLSPKEQGTLSTTAPSKTRYQKVLNFSSVTTFRDIPNLSKCYKGNYIFSKHSFFTNKRMCQTSVQH